MDEKYDYIIDAFTKDGDNTNLEVDNLTVGCITSKNNNFNLDSEGNLTVKSITSQEGSFNHQDVLDYIYPIGSVYITSKNENPGNKLGGAWELFDKNFKFYSGELPSGSYTLNSTNCSKMVSVLIREGHTMFLRLNITTKVALADSTVSLVTLHFNKMGLNNVDCAWGRPYITTSDGGNGIAHIMIGSTGEITSTDVVTKTSGGNIPSGSKIDLSYNLITVWDRIADEECDKFFWRRIG